MSDNTYCVYILTNKNHTVLYNGVTNNLLRRTSEHKQRISKGFTKKYSANRLVYYEATDDIYAAISREKKIKAGSRQKKIDLINLFNPEWNDLFESI